MEKSRRNSETIVLVIKPHGQSLIITISIVVIAIIAVGVMLSNGTLELEDGGAIAALIAVPIVGLVFWNMYLHATQSLTIYEDGIEHRYGSSTTFIAWDNMTHIEVRNIQNSFHAGIVSRQPLERNQTANGLDRFFHKRFDDYFMALTGIVKVSTSSAGYMEKRVDFYTLKQTEFGRILEKYAPHLFKEITL